VVLLLVMSSENTETLDGQFFDDLDELMSLPIACAFAAERRFSIHIDLAHFSKVKRGDFLEYYEVA
jgi:hypothetical protein